MRRPADLVAKSSNLNEYGSQVRFQQNIDGVQVYGGEIVTNLDKSGALESANGEVVAGDVRDVPGRRSAVDAAKATAQSGRSPGRRHPRQARRLAS